MFTNSDLFSYEEGMASNNDIEIYDLSDESDVDFENIFEEESEAYKMSVTDEKMKKVFTLALLLLQVL